MSLKSRYACTGAHEGLKESARYAHARKANTVRVIGYRTQRTLAGETSVAGVGLITGSPVTARFLPAKPDTGIVFRRIDLPGSPEVRARAESVSGTQRRTTLGPADTGVTLVEHLLAALAGLRIDNCIIELDGPEPPGLDGSSAGFVKAILDAGSQIQSERRPIYAVSAPIVISAPRITLALHPATSLELRATYRLDYGFGASIPPQSHTLTVYPATFATEIAHCRTFLTQAEATELRALGIGRHLTPTDLLVFGPRGPLNNCLRFADEPARHKILDLIGDLALCGFDLAGHLVAYRSGHTQNVELAQQLVARATEDRTPVGRKVVTAVRRAA